LEDLQNKKIAPWQAALRTGVPLDKIHEWIPQTPEHEPPPEFAPKWAGGKDQTPKKTTIEWEYQTLEKIHEGFENNSLLPYEAAMQYGIPIKEIQKFLEQLGYTLKGSPEWIPTWAKTKKPPTTVTHSQQLFLDTILWSEKETEALTHYWNLDILTPKDISELMEKPSEAVLSKAEELNLPKKRKIRKKWGGVHWKFQPDTDTDPKLLDPNTQRLVAEASATRFSLLYETLLTLQETDKEYKKIQREMERIVEMQTRIFSKYIGVKSRKYNYQGTSQWLIQAELEQAGKTAIFECLRRWHPNRKIRYSRGAVCIAITREMIAWVEKQRLIELPDRIRAVARKLKHAQDAGTLDQEYKRLSDEAGERCVREASKHQNTYAFISTVPLMDAYEETDAERGGVQSSKADCLEHFTSYEPPQENLDIGGLLVSAIQTLPDEEKRAVLSYHGLTETGEHTSSKTLEEIGIEEGVTKERIRQRISKAKERMKRWLERKEIRSLHDICTLH
jgi:DNA-directed RNA polymerase sigma subunit (sigma70/sigma32)